MRRLLGVCYEVICCLGEPGWRYVGWDVMLYVALFGMVGGAYSTFELVGEYVSTGD